jgi:hypothetical protein
MNQTAKLLILGAVGVGAYLFLTKGAYAAPRPGGAYSPIYPAGYGAPTAPNNPRAQKEALENSTLYGIGRLINGVFGGSAGNSGGAPMGTQPSAVAIGSGGGQWRPSTYDNAYVDDSAIYMPAGTYSVDPLTIGPTQPDAYAANPPGGYDQPMPYAYDSYDFQ